MKSANKLGFFICGLTSVFLSTAMTSTYAPKAQAAELVKNGDFELDPSYNSDPNYPGSNNSNITGWTKTNNPADKWITVIKGHFDAFNIPDYSDPEGTGKGSLRGGGYVDFGYLSQNLTTNPSQEYELTYILKTDDWPKFVDNTFQTFVGGEKIAELTNITFKPFDFTPPYDYSTYTQYTYKFAATSKSTELKFGYRNPNGFFYLDNVSVKPVPEPLTLGGTAVAGLLGIWLRRKQATNTTSQNSTVK